MSSKIIKAVVVVLIVLAALVFGARIISGEDNWVCKDGAWQKHGNPTSPMPNQPCN